MAQNTPPADRVLRRAADLRAGGNAWEAVGKAMGLSAETVRKWPVRYPARWRKAHAAAERRMLAEATAEAIYFLRKQLRSDDEKTTREAAGKLVQVRVALEKSRRKPRPAATSTDSADPPGYAERFVKLVRGITREQAVALDRLGSESGT